MKELLEILAELPDESGWWSGHNVNAAVSQLQGLVMQRDALLKRASTETLDDILLEYCLWRTRNFDDIDPGRLLLRTVGELGELVTAHDSEIYGGPEGETKDGVGDTVLFLAAYCRERGWTLRECIELAWHQVRERDYRKYPKTGRAGLEARS